MRRLRRRASVLRLYSYFVLLLISGALFGGIYLFAFAEELAGRTAVEQLEGAAQEQKELARTLRNFVDQSKPKIEQLVDTLTNIYAALGKQQESPLAEVTESLLAVRQQLIELLEHQQRAGRGQSTREDAELRRNWSIAAERWATVAEESRRVVANLSDVTNNLSGELEVSGAKLRELLDSKIREIDRTDPNRFHTALLVQALTTRLGAILILIFLVQILVSLYRYSVRLAGFYDARADAFELFGDVHDERALAFIAMLSPDAIDFGRVPASPAEHIAAIARSAASKSGS